MRCWGRRLFLSRLCLGGVSLVYLSFTAFLWRKLYEHTSYQLSFSALYQPEDSLDIQHFEHHGPPAECQWTRLKAVPSLNRPTVFNKSSAVAMMAIPLHCAHAHLFRKRRAALRNRLVQDAFLSAPRSMRESITFRKKKFQKRVRRKYARDHWTPPTTAPPVETTLTEEEQEETPFFLTAVLLVRLYRKDKAKLWKQELDTWLDYLRFAGVEHVLLYDAYHKEEEILDNHTREYREEGFLTYVDWSSRANPYGLAKTQVAAYQHAIDFFGHESEWQVAIDIDEYPFSPFDREPGFMTRYLLTIDLQQAYINARAKRPHGIVVEVSMENYLFLGAPNPATEKHIFGRYWRRNREPMNNLVKPVFRPDPNLLQSDVHRNILARGNSQRTRAMPEELRMNHYWGARMQNWGPDTATVFNSTVLDDGMTKVQERFSHCSMYLKSCTRTYE